MNGKKIEVIVPDGYRLKQDGIYIEFKNDIKYLYQKQ
jgi:hypothetical protein